MCKTYGPTVPVSEQTHAEKYRGKGETFKEAMARIAGTLADNDEHFRRFFDILLDMRFLPAGRQQAAIGSPRNVTAFNCFVSRTIDDSMDGIMDAAKEAALTMKLGGGIGYDFSTIRPRGAHIKTLESKSSGVVSFMQIFDSVCATVASAGNRRGAQMGVLRIDHPDIEEFIEAKTNTTNLKHFNISVGVTDLFMLAVESDGMFDLCFNGVVYSTVRARHLWEKLMRATWDWAEPGVLFIDRINQMNNLYYCESIAATNPCGEQPLPPYGACLLGSFNLTKYVQHDVASNEYMFDYESFTHDIYDVVRAQDNIIDNTVYPLQEQEQEAKSKRRMGLGITGLANAGEMLGYQYGSEEFISWADNVMSVLTESAYYESARLAKEKGCFPLFDKKQYLQSKYIQGLSQSTQNIIAGYGIRNSHLISFAPAGTISLCADNISSGIEPVFSYHYDRTIIKEGGAEIETVADWGVTHGIKGKTADKCTIDEHLAVLAIASKWSDSAVSKTINIGSNVTWGQFKWTYMRAWMLGCKGCTTFRADGKRFGVLKAKDEEGTACYYDPETGTKSCDS